MDEPREERWARIWVHRTLLWGVRASAVLLAAGLIAGSHAWVRAGILLLIATPTARVLVLAAAYARARRWGFLAVCCAVLALLLAGVLLSAPS